MAAVESDNVTNEPAWFSQDNLTEPCVTEQLDLARCLFLSILPHGKEVAAMLCVFILLIVFSFLINLLTLYCLAQSEDLLWQPRFTFLKNLIVSDLIQTVTCGPAVVHSMAQRRTMAFSGWCYIQYFVGSISVFCSLVTITCMALERYLYVCHAIHYLTILTHKRLRWILALIWLYSITIGIINTLLVHMGARGVNSAVTSGLLCEPDVVEQHLGFPRASALFRKLMGSLTLLLCLLAYAFSYVRMYQDAQNAVMPFNAVNVRARRMVLFYCAMLLLQLMPLLLKVTSDALWEIEGPAAMVRGSTEKNTFTGMATAFHLLLLLMLMVPPCVNPLVYGLRNVEVRQAFDRLIRDWMETSSRLVSEVLAANRDAAR